MAFLQFHDVFTGSHPTPVFREVEQAFEAVEELGAGVLRRALESLAPKTSASADGTTTILTVNGLPWERTDVVRAPIADNEYIARVTNSAGEAVSFEQRNGELRFLARVPAVGGRAVCC